MSANITLEQFLAPISEALGRVQAPSAPEPCAVLERLPRRVHTQDPGELEALFCASAEAMHVTVHRCPRNLVGAEVVAIVADGAGADIVVEDVEDADAEGASAPVSPFVIFPDDARVARYGIEDAMEEARIPCAIWNPEASAEANRAACLAAKFGLTFPALGVAETGSVVQFCDAGCGRSISLLPDTHIAVLEANAIRGQMREVLEELCAVGGDAGERMPSQVCFISGPSNTSDIELVRVEGVHGPVHVHYIVIEAAHAL